MWAGVLTFFAGWLLTVTGQDDPAQTWMLPFERTSIDDCHVRLYKIYAQYHKFRAVNARAALLRDFAHIAAIGWTQEDGRTVDWRCGGSLIWGNFILTAAHCIDDGNNVPPDVARLGDINIYSADDDEHAQQLKIVDIVRHPEHRFSSRYNDIALLRLEKNVTIHDTVAPACLWLDDEVRFPKLIAAGWGATGIGADRSERLLKVELSPVSNRECSSHHRAGERQLRRGLHGSHICAGDVKMDLCPGDSGGPLNVNLLTGDHLTPFLVGVTSFGKACGLSIPGVYTRVSSFVPWITDTLRQYGERVTAASFDPVECATRHRSVRENEYFDEPGDLKHPYVASFTQEQGNPHTVTILWPATAPSNCFGTLVEPDVVLTLAQCASHRGTRPNRVAFPDGIEVSIREVFVHPDYSEARGRYYNNLAVLRLAAFASAIPACGWYNNYLPEPVVRVRGRSTRPGSPGYTPVLAQSTSTPREACRLSDRDAAELPRGLQDEHVCLYDRHHLVPGTCDLLPGAAIERLIDPSHPVLGLSMFGRDCGYGEPAVAVRLGAHRTWLESVLLPRKDDSALLYIDTDLGPAGACRFSDGTEGSCVSVANCPGLDRWRQAGQQVVFCRTGSIVCCPRDLVAAAAGSAKEREIERELNECDARYRHLRRRNPEYLLSSCLTDDRLPHVVEIGWKGPGPNTSFECFGYLITTRALVSAASCLLAKGNLPGVVRLGGMLRNESSTPMLLNIDRVVVHPRYDAPTRRHDIAIVMLPVAVEPTESVFPGCVWQNVTHLPVIQQVLNDERNRLDLIHPMYRSDCETVLNRPLGAPATVCMSPGVYKYSYTHGELGTELNRTAVYDQDSQCFRAGNPVVWSQCGPGQPITEYLVSIYGHGDCGVTSLRIVEQVALYVNWFKRVLGA